MRLEIQAVARDDWKSKESAMSRRKTPHVAPFKVHTFAFLLCICCVSLDATAQHLLGLGSLDIFPKFDGEIHITANLESTGAGTVTCAMTPKMRKGESYDYAPLMNFFSDREDLSTTVTLRDGAVLHTSNFGSMPEFLRELALDEVESRGGSLYLEEGPRGVRCEARMTPDISLKSARASTKDSVEIRFNGKVVETDGVLLHGQEDVVKWSLLSFYRDGAKVLVTYLPSEGAPSPLPRARPTGPYYRGLFIEKLLDCLKTTPGYRMSKIVITPEIFPDNTCQWHGDYQVERASPEPPVGAQGTVRAALTKRFTDVSGEGSSLQIRHHYGTLLEAFVGSGLFGMYDPPTSVPALTLQVSCDAGTLSYSVKFQAQPSETDKARDSGALAGTILQVDFPGRVSETDGVSSPGKESGRESTLITWDWEKARREGLMLRGRFGFHEKSEMRRAK